MDWALKQQTERVAEAARQAASASAAELEARADQMEEIAGKALTGGYGDVARGVVRTGELVTLATAQQIALDVGALDVARVLWRRLKAKAKEKRREAWKQQQEGAAQ